MKVAVSVEAGLAGLAFAFAWLCGCDLLSGARLDAAALLLGLLATGPLFLMLAVIMRSPAESCVRIRQILDEVLLPWLSPCHLVDLVLLATLAGVAEEFLFRAFLQSLLTDQFGAAVGLVIASLLFGIAHWITPGYAILAGIAGFYLGIVWMLTAGNPVVVIIAHGVYDLIALIVLLQQYRSVHGRLLRDDTHTGDPGSPDLTDGT